MAVALENLILAAVALVVFLLPIAANLVLHWPGEFGKYLAYATSQNGFNPRTAADVIGFALGYWIRSGWWLLVLVASAVALAFVTGFADGADRRARFRRDLVLMCGLEFAQFVFYAARGVDDLGFAYVGWFILACPLLVLWTGMDTILDVLDRRFERSGRIVAAASCAVLAVVLLGTGQSSNPYRGMPHALADALPRSPVRLAFDRPGWTAGLGLVQDARRRGQQVCIVDRRWKFIATPALICSNESKGELVYVFGPGEPRTGPTIYDDGTTALMGE